MRPLFKVIALVISSVAIAGCSSNVAEFNPDDYRSGLHAYSAGQAALVKRDTNTAANHYLNALAQDPENTYIRARAFELLVTNGRFDEARQIDKDLPPGRAAYGISRMLKVVDHLSAHDFAAAEKALDEATGTGFDGLIKPIALAWILAGQGDQEGAVRALDPLISRPAALSQFAKEHKAMILAYTGDWAQAERLYLEIIELSGGGSPRFALDYVARLAHRKDWEGAEAVLQSLLKANPRLLRLKQVETQLRAKKKPVIQSSSPADGLAEALYRVSTEMVNRTTAPTGILYARLATTLKPRFDDAFYLIGEALASQQLPLDAYRAFDEIEKKSPIYLPAQTRKAGLLSDLARSDDGVNLMKQVVAGNPDYVQGHMTLGDLYRSQENFQAAADAYTAAVLLTEASKAEDWFLYYARGIAFEQTDNWTLAEADFIKALALRPNEPFVLNYLGYSWIDRGIKYDEARAMIENAVKQRPDDGFIVDSLGWAHYLGGEYEKAVEVLERAVALQPGDATINDHLGDAYWQVGRTIEARFKWRHTLDLDADDALIARVRQKLDLGLSIVEAQK